MNSGNSSKLRQVIRNARTIPVALYQLGFINLVLVIGLVIRGQSFLYLLGCFVLVLALMVLVGKFSGLFQVPQSIISDNVYERLVDIERDILGWVNALQLQNLKENNISFIINVLLIVYISSLLNGTLQIFVLFNFIYLQIFMPREIQGLVGKARQLFEGLISRMGYNK